MPRLCGRHATVALVPAALILAGCTDGTYDVMEACGTRGAQPIRVEQSLCDREPNKYGKYHWQLPKQQYDSDGNGYWGSVVVPPVGQPMTGGTAGAAPGADRARVATPSNSGSSTITRGGLGVSGYSGSSGS